MSESELISACIKNDKAAQKELFEHYYGSLAAIALRYSKNRQQADDIIHKGFSHLFSHLAHFDAQGGKPLKDWLKREFATFTVNHIKSIRGEYYVASTVRVTDHKQSTYDLFLDSDVIDYAHVDFDTLVKSLQQLVPAQRLVFNLYVVDGFSFSEISGLLETSEQTIKANLEKGRFNLQKNIEKNIKALKNESV